MWVKLIVSMVLLAAFLLCWSKSVWRGKIPVISIILIWLSANLFSNSFLYAFLQDASPIAISLVYTFLCVALTTVLFLLKARYFCGSMYFEIDVILLALFMSSSLRLFYNQAVRPNGKYNSDLPAHIRGALNHDYYSIAGLSMGVLYSIWPSYYGIALMLSVVCVLTSVAGGACIAFFLKESNGGKVDTLKYIPLGTAMSFLSNIWLPVISPVFYMGYLNTVITQPWHNSTYLFMRLFGLLGLAVYFQIEKHYMKRITIKEYLVFSALLLLTNFSKPNFIIAFAPVMLLYLIRDFLRTKGRSFRQNLIFGTCVLISMPLLLWQSSVLFPSSGNKGVVLTLTMLNKYFTTWRVLPLLICGLSFPMIVLVLFRWKKIRIGRLVCQSWIMWLLSFLEYMLLAETGSRTNHGNFGWGGLFFAMFLFLVSAVEWIQAYQAGKLEKRLYMIGWTPLILSTLNGLVRYFLILYGAHYKM